MTTNIQRSPKYHEFPTYPATLYMNNVPILSNPRNALQNASTTQQLRLYLQQQNTWSDAAIDSIDWEIHAYTLNKYRFADKKRLQKFYHDWLPINKRLNRRAQKHQTNAPPATLTMKTANTYSNAIIQQE